MLISAIGLPKKWSIGELMQIEKIHVKSMRNLKVIQFQKEKEEIEVIVSLHETWAEGEPTTSRGSQ